MKTDRLVILAAGSSTRMSRSLGFTHNERITKCMIPVGRDRKPFLEYLLSNVEKAGFKEVVLVTAAADTSIEEHFGDGFGDLAISRVVQAVPPDRRKPAG
ncbi:MAG: NTP transferase domain-containing protein, partial [bacterium]|nr:NTP transferase domain-containing protein [bacterium]